MLSTQTQKIPKDKAPQNIDSKSKICNNSSCHEREPAEITASRIGNYRICNTKYTKVFK